jgi:hypothetical protein
MSYLTEVTFFGNHILFGHCSINFSTPTVLGMLSCNSCYHVCTYQYVVMCQANDHLLGMLSCTWYTLHVIFSSWPGMLPRTWYFVVHLICYYVPGLLTVIISNDHSVTTASCYFFVSKAKWKGWVCCSYEARRELGRDRLYNVGSFFSKAADSREIEGCSIYKSP